MLSSSDRSGMEQPAPARNGVFGSLMAHRGLALALVQREVSARYRGSFGGLLWALATPLLMLALYTTVFGVILQAKWAKTGNQAEFALVLFAGLLVFSLFGECLVRAPALVTGNPNLVKKVVFPIEILAWVNLGGALVHFGVGLAVWMVFYAVLHASLHPSLVLLPLVVLPVCLMALAVGWLFGALGVYMRDVAQVAGPLSLAMMFLTPVFFDLSSVPRDMQWLFIANPLTLPIEQARAVMLEGSPPQWGPLIASTLGAWLVAALSLAFFKRAQPDFPDLL
jgi:lipopolysaccharide transport system permease protein